jgi:hypothetical protein
MVDSGGVATMIEVVDDRSVDGDGSDGSFTRPRHVG